MEIESVRYKALRAFIESGKPRGIDARMAQRLRNMVAFLTAAGSADELYVPPNFGFHRLVGDHSGVFAMTVTKNWRLTFKIGENQAIVDLDLEDYH